MSTINTGDMTQNGSLNPCCNGIYSMSIELMLLLNTFFVLILVVMEYTQ